MRERPILFSGPMVRALLAGTKTQTRRVVKFKPPFSDPRSWGAVYKHPNGGWIFTDTVLPETVQGQWIRKMAHNRDGKLCPYGTPGDRLFVKETFTLQCDTNGDLPPFNDGRPVKQTGTEDEGYGWLQPHYRATDPTPELDIGTGDPGVIWKPSIHMPRWASRITLEVTDVRVQRVQEISPEDARAEGFPATIPDGTSRGQFMQTWDQINARRGFGWDVNPWVWAVTFRRLDAGCVEDSSPSLQVIENKDEAKRA